MVSIVLCGPPTPQHFVTLVKETFKIFCFFAELSIILESRRLGSKLKLFFFRSFVLKSCSTRRLLTPQLALSQSIFADFRIRTLFSLALSFSNTRTHTRSLTFSLSHTLSTSLFSFSLSLSHTLSISLLLSLSFSNTISFSLSNT